MTEKKGGTESTMMIPRGDYQRRHGVMGPLCRPMGVPDPEKGQRAVAPNRGPRILQKSIITDINIIIANAIGHPANMLRSADGGHCNRQ